MQMGLPNEDARFAILMKKLEALNRELRQQYGKYNGSSHNGNSSNGWSISGSNSDTPSFSTPARPPLKVPSSWLDRDFKCLASRESSIAEVEEVLSSSGRVRDSQHLKRN
jgi:hypothetical protein